MIVASALFAFYVANFGSYSATYGSLGGIIVFLLWLWIANNGLLLGQELNAELERARVARAVSRPARERLRERDPLATTADAHSDPPAPCSRRS